MHHLFKSTNIDYSERVAADIVISAIRESVSYRFIYFGYDSAKSADIANRTRDAIFCRGFPFPGTLKGAASNWFRKYKKGNNKSLDQPFDLFLTNFENQKRIWRTCIHLMTLKQREEETLLEYVGFKNETISTC